MDKKRVSFVVGFKKTDSAPHRFSIQLFVDFDLARHRLNEELVLTVAADDGVQDITVHLAVHVFGGHLRNQTDVRMSRTQSQCHAMEQMVKVIVSLLKRLTNRLALSYSSSTVLVRFTSTTALPMGASSLMIVL